MITPKRAEEEKLPDDSGIIQLQAALKRYCLSLTRSSWDAEDLVQDTWVKALDPLRSGHGNPEAFLLRIAKNTWLDAARRKTALSQKLPLLLGPAAVTQGSGDFAAEMALQAMMKHLSPLQRTVFLLRDVLEYSAAEAAALLGTTEGAVKAALHRARRALPALREELAPDGPPLPEEPGFRALLKRMAAACERADIAELIALARLEDEPAEAVGWMQDSRPSQSTGRSGGGTVKLMAA
ncbi:RNA polymerase sigma factor [Paenibacillus sp. 7124]|uniref:RNA polymerase sigma factor n=1 Tax=Paenibacillus apii TaxID=1850370 RepID=A0A6M1PQH5_9BACL|nr:RNA polymerase sigma factor [Paenibacillus apii]NGM84594.1 RNA polymerase sigma factor [Paenibacillus apii]